MIVDAMSISVSQVFYLKRGIRLIVYITLFAAEQLTRTFKVLVSSCRRYFPSCLLVYQLKCLINIFVNKRHIFF